MANALEKPKVAGIQGDLKFYEDTTRLVLKTATNLDGDDLGKQASITGYINEDLGKDEKFNGGKSKLVNAYGNEYNLDVEINEGAAVEENKKQKTVTIRTTGKKKDYKVVVIEKGGVVETCTVGFGRNDKGLTTFESELCDSIGEGTTPTPDGDIAGGGDTTGSGNPLDDYESVADVPAGCNEIWVPQDLYDVRTKPTKNWIVMADIDLATFADNEDADGFTPIPTFSGVLDGNGYSINNLKQSKDSGTGDMGLFAKVAGGEIKNLGLNNTLITSKGNNVGSLIGSMTGGNLNNLHARGLNTNSETGSPATEKKVGGLIGLARGASLKVTNVTVTMTVKSNMKYVGGVFGGAEGIKVERVWAKGDLVGEGVGTHAGGVIGKSVDGLRLKEVFAEVNVTSDNAGGDDRLLH